MISDKCKELELVAVAGINERDHGLLQYSAFF